VRTGHREILSTCNLVWIAVRYKTKTTSKHRPVQSQNDEDKGKTSQERAVIFRLSGVYFSELGDHVKDFMTAVLINAL
jgi:hypothetical protein